MKIPWYHLTIELLSSVIVVLLLMFIGFEFSSILTIVIVVFASMVLLSYPFKIMVKNWRDILAFTQFKFIAIVAVTAILMISGFLANNKCVEPCPQAVSTEIGLKLYVLFAFGRIFSNNPMTNTITGSSQGSSLLIDFAMSLVLWYLLFAYIFYYVGVYKQKRRDRWQAGSLSRF